MIWSTGHLWNCTVVIAPRNTQWWYSLISQNVEQRVEDLELPREYDFDCKDKYFQIVDRWNDHFSSVTPIGIKKFVSSNSMSPSIISRYVIPRYQASLERRKSNSQPNREILPSTFYHGVDWGYKDDWMLDRSNENKPLTLYSFLREGKICN